MYGNAAVRGEGYVSLEILLHAIVSADISNAMTREDVLRQRIMEATQDVIRTPEKWADFLRFSARMHERPFVEQMSIYAVRSDALEVATFQGWKMRDLWLRPGSHSIPMLTQTPYGHEIKLVFDARDVMNYRAREKANPFFEDPKIQKSIGMVFRGMPRNAGVVFSDQDKVSLMRTALSALEHHADRRSEGLNGSQWRFVVESATYAVMSRLRQRSNYDFARADNEAMAQHAPTAQRLAIQSIYLSNRILNDLDWARDYALTLQAKVAKESGAPKITGVGKFGPDLGRIVKEPKGTEMYAGRRTTGLGEGRARNVQSDWIHADAGERGAPVGDVRPARDDAPANARSTALGTGSFDQRHGAVPTDRSGSEGNVSAHQTGDQGTMRPTGHERSGETHSIRADDRKDGDSNVHRKELPEDLIQYGFFVDRDMRISHVDDSVIFVCPKGRAYLLIRDGNAMRVDGFSILKQHGDKPGRIEDQAEVEASFLKAANESAKLERFIGMKLQDFTAFVQDKQPVPEHRADASMEI